MLELMTHKVRQSILENKTLGSNVQQGGERMERRGEEGKRGERGERGQEVNGMEWKGRGEEREEEKRRHPQQFVKKNVIVSNDRNKHTTQKEQCKRMLKDATPS